MNTFKILIHYKKFISKCKYTKNNKNIYIISVITSSSKFYHSTKIYIKSKDNKLLLFIKIRKNIYLLMMYRCIVKINQMNFLYALNFYIYDNCQKSGYCKIIYIGFFSRKLWIIKKTCNR